MLQNIFLLLAIYLTKVSAAATSNTPSLGMQVLCSHGYSQFFNIESQYSFSNDNLPSPPMHNIKVSSGSGSTTLEVTDQQIEIKHTGNAWVVILNPSNGLVIDTVYPNNITGRDIFKPDPLPRGLSKEIKEDGIFIIVVPLVESDRFEIKPNDMLGSLLSFDGTDVSSTIEGFKGFTKALVKNQIIFMVLGRFVKAPKPSSSVLVQQTAELPSFSLDYTLKSLKHQTNCPYVFGNISTWNFSNILASHIGPKTGQIAFATADGFSSAGVELSMEGPNIKMTFAQTGQASIYVVRPSSERFIFPDYIRMEEFLSNSYISLESVRPKIIQEDFKVGDVIIILVPINSKETWQVSNRQVLNLLYLLALNPILLQQEHILGTMFDTISMEQASQVFLSFCTITQKGAVLAPVDALNAITHWPRIQEKCSDPK